MGGQRATVPLHRVGRRGHQIHLDPGKVGDGPMITVSAGNRLLPWVWSPCWWVLTAQRTGAPRVALPRASRNRRVRDSVAQVSTTRTPS